MTTMHCNGPPPPWKFLPHPGSRDAPAQDNDDNSIRSSDKNGPSPPWNCFPQPKVGPGGPAKESPSATSALTRLEYMVYVGDLIFDKRGSH